MKNITFKDICRETQAEFMKQFVKNSIMHPKAHEEAKAAVMSNRSDDWCANQAKYWEIFNNLVPSTLSVKVVK